ncbi:MAG: orotidine-5'-phosphate decarboxylase [Deltaproteobacteria bacterium]|nr:MAG: orotidine-5'-phosphate decarboxylase [Deltaproteobacteria bacterium]
MPSKEDNPVIFALDVGSWDEALRFVDELKEWVWGFKIGKELFTWLGPKVVEMVHERGGRVFLDLKYHDIPATVARASAMATRLGVAMFDLHTLGGLKMMSMAVEASHEVAQKEDLSPPKILGVTVLTSLGAAELRGLGVNRTLQEEVVLLAKLALKAGLDGVIASPQEIKPLREACGEDIVIVTPGVRPRGSLKNDHARAMSPKEALEAGADYLVIGRPIRDAPHPTEAARQILDEIRSSI